MTTENQASVTLKNLSHNQPIESIDPRLTSKLEEKKGNAAKPLSLRPGRSIKKNSSLKPLGIRSR